jgi:hypothetical protein
MAPVLPSSREQMIAWFAARAPDWAANAAAIGISPAQVLEVAARLSAAENTLTIATNTRIASKDATIDYYSDADSLREYGADLIKVIKAFAESNDDQGVYALASVPPPAPPSPAGPPPAPTNLTIKLLPGGGLRLAWKGTTSQSAFFGVYRKAEGETAFTLLDAPADKFFDDTTIPAEANTVTYYIQARRDDFRIDSGHLVVSFGAGGQTATMTLAA